MREPYKEIKTIDETRGISSTPPDNGFNIVMPIHSPTGPIERTKVSGQSDLIDKFLTSDRILATHHTTIHHAAKILTKNPLYVLRVDPTQIRVGLGSTGRTLYFTKNNEFIDRLTRVNFNTNVPYAIPVVHVAIGTDLYYMGDVSAIDPAISAAYSSKIEITGAVSIDNFFKLINIKRIDEDKLPVLIYVKDGQVRSNAELKDASSTISKWIKSVFVGRYTKYAVGLAPSIKVREAEYISIGNYSPYFKGSDLTDISEIPNPIPVEANYGGDITAVTFFARAIDEINKNANLRPISALEVAGSIILKFGALTVTSVDISTELAKHLHYEIEAGSETLILTLANMYNILSNQYVKVTLSDSSTVAFLIGSDDSLEADTIISFSDNTSAVKLLSLIDEMALTSTDYTVEDFEFTKFTFMYDKDTEPAVALSFLDQNVVTVSDDISTTYEYLHSTDAENSAQHKYSNIWLKIGTVLFYVGTSTEEAETRVKLSSNSVSLEEFYTLLKLALPDYFTTGILSSDFIISGEYIQTAGEDSQITFSEGLDVISNVVIQEGLTDKFALITKFPCTQNIFKFSYSINETDPDIIDLTLEYNGKVNEYQISFLDDKVDGFGLNLYYERLNEGDLADPNFFCKELTGLDVLTSFTSRLFGGEIKIPEPSIQNFKDTMTKLRDLDDMYYDIIFDGGVTDSGLAKHISAIATDLPAFYPVSVPFKEQSAAVIKAFRDATQIDHAFTNFIIPGYSDSSLGNFIVPFSGGMAYIDKLIDNFQTVTDEFAPVFGPNHGLVTIGNPYAKLGKDDRESLLDKQINTIFKGKNGYQINMNLTAQKISSYISEEQNARLNIKVAHICDTYVESLIGEYNTEALRLLVTSSLEDLIKQRLSVNKTYSYQKMRVLCNDDNNPQSIIEQRLIVIAVEVMYQNSIAYIRVYNRVKRLGSF